MPCSYLFAPAPQTAQSSLRRRREVSAKKLYCIGQRNVIKQLCLKIKLLKRSHSFHNFIEKLEESLKKQRGTIKGNMILWEEMNKTWS